MGGFCGRGAACANFRRPNPPSERGGQCGDGNGRPLQEQGSIVPVDVGWGRPHPTTFYLGFWPAGRPLPQSMRLRDGRPVGHMCTFQSAERSPIHWGPLIAAIPAGRRGIDGLTGRPAGVAHFYLFWAARLPEAVFWPAGSQQRAGRPAVMAVAWRLCVGEATCMLWFDDGGGVAATVTAAQRRRPGLGPRQ